MTFQQPRSPFHDHDYPADPYPGARPDVSFAHVGTTGYPVWPNTSSPSRWRVYDINESFDLDEWLTEQGAAPLRNRLPVLAYGSNSNPEKITWLRDQLGLQGPAVVFRAEVEGIAAVWSAGTRARDSQRPAVLAAMPGTETHTVWLVTPDQRKVLDQCEGRGERYRLSWVRTTARLGDGTSLGRVLAYTARPEVIGHQVPEHLNRSPLLIDGRMVRVSDMDQETAAHAIGAPAATDGLDCEEVVGEPDTPQEGDTIDRHSGQDRP